MGRLTAGPARVAVVLASLALVAALVGARPAAPAWAGGGFSDLRADATFGEDLTFSAAWNGPSPDRVELLIGFGGEERLVVPLELSAGRVSYRRDVADEFIVPNTEVTYRWRAVSGSETIVTPELTIRYDDDRPGFAWQSARIGSATVHWYGESETIARRFGTLAGEAADQASALLGHPLASPIDIFVYDSREGFLGAVGPGTREWVGAASFPGLRTVFMWTEAGSGAFLELALVHEVTHVLFDDATANPYHEPPAWLNEGVATWAEVGNADTERDVVAREARSTEGLYGFAGLTDQFPIDARGATLAYAQGTTMVDLILETGGSDALAKITAAYRDGATDHEAIRAATGRSFADLTAEYFAAFGVPEPQPIAPRPLERSDVPLPPQPGGGAGPSPAPGGGGDGQADALSVIIGVMVVIVGGLAVLLVVLVARARRTVNR